MSTFSGRRHLKAASYDARTGEPNHIIDLGGDGMSSIATAGPGTQVAELMSEEFGILVFITHKLWPPSSRSCSTGGRPIEMD